MRRSVQPVARGFDEDILAVGEHQTPRHPCVDHPAGDGEHEDDVQDPTADDVEDEQRQQQRRESHLDVDQAHDRVVDVPAIEPGQKSQDVPTVPEMTTLTRPTASETRLPKMSRLSSSRPNWSVPMMWESTRRLRASSSAACCA